MFSHVVVHIALIHSYGMWFLELCKGDENGDCMNEVYQSHLHMLDRGCCGGPFLDLLDPPHVLELDFGGYLTSTSCLVGD